MKAAVYTRYGPPEVLQLKEVDKPVPKNNEVLIRVCATVVTSGDVRMRKADPFIVRIINGFLKPKRPILGVNFAGIIEEAGKDARLFKKNDRVFGSTVLDFGTYAEYVCVSEDGVLAEMPSNVSYEEAAVVPFGTLTSLHFLRKGNVSRGNKVLIYGASGSLGTAAVQLAKYFGAEVTAVCSTVNLGLVKSLGADEVLDYTKNEFLNSTKTFDFIYDTVGRIPFFACVKKLNQGGIFLNAVHIPPFSLLKDLCFFFSGGKRVIGGMSLERKDDLIFIKGLIEGGKYKPVIDRCYMLEQISEAHRYVEQGHKKGNVAVTVAT